MADFITINIGSILNGQSPTNGQKPTTQKEVPTGAEQKPEQKKTTTRIDWSKELKKRLDDNKALDQEARESEYEIESRFWDEFFKANWPEDIAEILDKVIGEQLKKDIKVLGFKKQSNPIIAFLKLSYVQKELIKTILINNNTYKAIHNTVAKHYVADSELFKASDYNILYCKDLYTKRIADIELYLAAQKQILPTNVSEYTLERQNRNKRIFLEVGKKSVKQKDAKLNSLKEIQKLLGAPISTGKTKDSTKASGTNNDIEAPQFASEEKLSAFVAEQVNSPADVAAALQYVVMTTGNSSAKTALAGNSILKQLSVEHLIEPASKIAKQLKNSPIADKDIESFVQELLNRLAGVR